ncbi:hypothetical protein WJ0W_001896 [Paenibacillus melissococcoides]|uniref:Uncharacterized protein n=1 Tax=Paenibacillus melissococcoides TaxID=2912268 RepID=A0ABM9G015_9BACL|nr:hypothetical protein WJ0W_001896 [Paenibacillus melissococcoides]
MSGCAKHSPGSKKAPLIGALTLSITYAHAWRQLEWYGAFHAEHSACPPAM